MLKKQSISDWALEHQECVGHALEAGIDNWDDLWNYSLAHMIAVNEDYLKEIWHEHSG